MQIPGVVMYDPEKFQTLLDGLVEQNRALRDAAMGWGVAPSQPSGRFAAEWCTVTCDIGRRSGKSEWIRRTATEDDLIVTMDQDMARHAFSPNQTKATVLTARTLHKAKGKRYSTVFVDEPRYVFDVINIDEFYALLAVDRDVTFVLLGMR